MSMSVQYTIGDDKAYYLIIDGVATHKYTDFFDCKNHMLATVRNDAAVELPPKTGIRASDHGWVESR